MIQPQFFKLPSATVFLVEGKDALRYLNARLSNDIKLLEPGSTCRAAMLTAQGKTEGLFQVIAKSESQFLLVADYAESVEVRGRLLSALKRFIVADRVSVSDLTESNVLLHLIASDETLSKLYPLPESTRYASLGALLLFWQIRSPQAGVDILCSSDESTKLMVLLREHAFSEVSSEYQTLLRIKAGIPNYPFEMNEQALFSEASLSNAVSFKKGCYVGQEVVEKVAALGRLPKRLFRLRAEGAIQVSSKEAEASVYDVEGAPIGKLTSYAYESETDTTYAFATLKNLTHLVSAAKVKVSDHWGEVI